MFSGRPNPRWQIDEADVQTLQRLHARLSVSRAPREQPTGLGYRGFCYELDAQSLRAVRGQIIGARAMLDDLEFTVERFLLDLVPAEFATLRDRIRGELHLTS